MLTANIHKTIFAVALLLVMAAPSRSQGFVKTNGTSIVNENGKNIVLRGMGLGGWMLQEGYMLQINSNGTQHSIKQRITELIGLDDCNTYYDKWLQNHVTKADIDSMAKWGFNSVRLPMHYNLYTLPTEDEPIANENTWLEKGFAMTDSLLAWCKANGIYLILDLHAAPGGQGHDANISDYDTTKPSLWESDANKQKTVALWRKLAERYANEPALAGYDILNEPNWSFEGKDKHGREDTLNQPIWDLYKDITQAIRQVDSNHLIIIEGNGWGNNYSGFEGAWDTNMALSFHKYWNPNTQTSINHILEARQKHNMPVWLGESGENSNKWFTDCITLLEANNIGWSWWPLKKIGSVVGPMTVVPPVGYKQITDYWNHNGPKPSAREAKETLMQVAENLKASNCIYHPDVIDAMFRQTTSKATTPFGNNAVPGTIFAVNYDMGPLGNAYFDTDSENIGGIPGQSPWNKGHAYRNDGVDITFCNDQETASNGYCVFETVAGEWMQYSLTVKKSGNYQLSVRVASELDGGMIAIDIDGKPISNPTAVPNTKGFQNWQTLKMSKIKLAAGQHILKMKIGQGGFALSSIIIK